MRVAVLLVLLFCTSLTYASETWLTLPIASWHADRTRDGGRGKYEQTNPGLGLEYAYNDRWRFAAGLYRNSIRHDSGYVGLGYFPLNFSVLEGNIRLGGSVGVISGYQTNLIPVFVPTLAIEKDGWGANILFIPAYDGKPGGAGFVLKFRLP